MKKVLFWGIPAAVLIALLAWRFTHRAATPGPPGGGGGGRGGGAAASVEVAPATSRTISEVVQSVGNLESPFKVEISPKTAGRISFLEVREGDPVVPNQVILKIDPSDLQGALLQQEAAVGEARSRLAQAQITTGATDVGISSQIQQQKASVASAQADLNQVENNYAATIASAQASVSAARDAYASAQASLQKENSTLQNVQAKYQRTLNVYNQGFIAAQDVDDARTAVDVEKGAVTVAQGAVSSARSQLNIQQQNLTIAQRKGQSDIADSKAKLTQANATLAVAVANRAQSPAYRANLAALKSQVDAAVAQVGQAKSKLADTVVRSSIAGTVTARKADPGALATPGTPVLEVQYLNWLYVTASAPIEYSGQIHEGQTAEITIDGLRGKTFSGPIINLNAAADPTSRQFGLKVRLDNAQHILRPGMFGRVSVVIQRVKADVVVPNEALKTNPDGSTTVTVVDKDNVAHVNPVKIGVRDDKGAQILDGVKPGDKVVVLTYATLKDGQKVTVGGGQGSSGRRGRGRGSAGGAGAPGAGGSGSGARRNRQQQP